MPTVEKVSVALSADLLEEVREAVANGEYASASEVVQEALEDWRMRKPSRQADIERLRQAWAEGIASGPARPVDFEEIKRRGRLRLAAHKAG